MNREVFVIIQGYFLIGAILFHQARRAQPVGSKPPWRKYLVYLLVVNLVVFSITTHRLLFRILALTIVIGGLVEIMRALKGKSSGFTIGTLALYLLLTVGFISFSGLPSRLLLWTYLIIFLFDGFSQICGQLFGRTNLAATISPGKTLEGSLGAMSITLLSAAGLSYLWELNVYDFLALALLICCTALLGDLLASSLKRRCGIKDFGKVLPGHGGLLDRFDSFLFSGAVIWLLWLLAAA